MAKIAFVLETDYEDAEFQQPYDWAHQQGHETTVIGTQSGKELTGKKGNSSIKVDATPDDVDVDQFDALVVPGGYSPDKLRLDDRIVKFTRSFFETGKPLAAICHAGQLLVEAGIVEGKRLTSWPSVRTELELAGADWVDEEVVEDGHLITSRKPDDIPAWIDALAARLEG